MPALAEGQGFEVEEGTLYKKNPAEAAGQSWRKTGKGE